VWEGGAFVLMGRRAGSERRLRYCVLNPPTTTTSTPPATLPTTTFSTYNMPTGFFDLPRELRDEIYTHLWTSMPRILIPYTRTLHLKATFRVPFFPGDQCSSLPPSLSANKLLLHEALLAFHSKGIVRVPLFVRNFEQEYSHRPCLTPTLLREIHVGVLAHPELAYFPVGRILHCLVPDSINVLTRLINDYRRIGSHRVFRIGFKAGNYISGLPQDIDLRPIQELARIVQGLDKVQIMAADTESGRRQTEFRSLLRRKMEELGEKSLR
jgi:hypothetical protein